VTVVTDGGPWRGPSEEEWLERIARPSTPAGETIPWIKPHNPRDIQELEANERIFVRASGVA
jgi:hypothetical protein